MSSPRFSAAMCAALAALGADGCGRSSQSSGTSPPPERTEAASRRGSQGDAPGVGQDAAPRAIAVTLAEVGIDPESLDRTADPCADFYQFACGGWEEKTKIPAGEQLWTRFSELRRRNLKSLRGMLEKASRNPPTGDEDLVKLGAYYAACMDEQAIEAAGTRAIDGLLERARAVKNRDTLAAALAEIHRYGIPAVFAFAPAPDFEDPATEVLFLDSAGIGLPDRDYYLIGKDRFEATRKAYRKHLRRVFTTLGMPAKAARRAAADTLKIETELARASKGSSERRVVEWLYNRVDRKGLTELAPAFPWDAYFAALGRPDLSGISVTTPRFFREVNRLLKRVRPKAWSHYLQSQIVHATAPMLAKGFADEHFAFLGKTLGRRVGSPRWERCLSDTDAAMGHALGHAFVRRQFGERGKETATLLLREVRAALGRRLQASDWLSPGAKRAALEKLELVRVLVGSAETRPRYDFEVSRGTYAANALAARASEVRRMLARVDKPADRTRWERGAHVANASYNWLANQLTLPAGFLQPPLFSARHSIPVNLGAMGSIAGHELTHAFDDRGSMFDGAGRMASWWRPEDAEAFKQKSQCFIEQFGQYEPLPGRRLSGRLTLSENIADLGGVQLAFDAHRALAARDDKIVTADGFSEDQQFFLAAGQVWCGKARKAELRRLLTAGTYTPPRYRVNGALANLPQFAETFACAEGSPMRRDPVCAMW